MNKYIICAYYTKKTPYQNEITNLVKSCSALGIPCITKGYDSRGAWVHNCAIKPEFIFEMLNTYPDINIVYIDADARIRQQPVLFETLTSDIAVHYRNGKELLSGTIFIKNTPKMRRFIRMWIDAQQVSPKEWDQRTLQLCISKYKFVMSLDVYNLPPTYTQIFDTMKDCGTPVIEHFQASRRFKSKVDNYLLSKIPAIVGGIKTRIYEDGTFFVPRSNEAVAAFLSKNFCKLPNEDRWYPRSECIYSLESLKPFFENKACYVVGKGPSLDRLTAQDFSNPEIPVICINEAIHKIESLGLPNQHFVLQQDAWLKSTCKPKNAIMLLSHTCFHWYADIRDKYVFHWLELGLKKQYISAVFAMQIAKISGATSLILYAFDAAVNQDTEYAKVIGYDCRSGGSPTRFLSHRKCLQEHAKPLPLTFFMPKDLSNTSDDKLLHNIDNH